jgi:hypothetical protein
MLLALIFWLVYALPKKYFVSSLGLVLLTSFLHSTEKVVVILETKSSLAIRPFQNTDNNFGYYRNFKGTYG